MFSRNSLPGSGKRPQKKMSLRYGCHLEAPPPPTFPRSAGGICRQMRHCQLHKRPTGNKERKPRTPVSTCQAKALTLVTCALGKGYNRRMYDRRMYNRWSIGIARDSRLSPARFDVAGYAPREALRRGSERGRTPGRTRCRGWRHRCRVRTGRWLNRRRRSCHWGCWGRCGRCGWRVVRHATPWCAGTFSSPEGTINPLVRWTMGSRRARCESVGIR